MIKVGMAAAKKQDNPLLEPAYGAAGGTAGTATGALVALLFLMFVFVLFQKVMMRQMRRDRTKHQDGYGQILKVLLLTIAPILFSTATYNINQIIDLTLFAKIMAAQGVTLKEYIIPQGIYTGKYNTLINIPLAMANGLAASVIPALTAAVASRNRTQMQNKINQTIRLTMLIAIPCFVGFVVLGIADHAVPLRRFQNGTCTDAGIRGDHSCAVQFFNSYKLDSAGTGPADCTGKECVDFTGDPSCGSPFDAGCFQMGDLFSRIQ